METVVRLARNETNAAAGALARARQVVEDQMHRLQELETYRREYIRLVGQLGGDGISASRLNEYRRFIARIDEAIRQQRRHLAHCQAELERCREGWQRARLQEQAMDRYQHRCREEERRRALQKEQKESDERAQYRRLP